MTNPCLSVLSDAERALVTSAPGSTLDTGRVSKETTPVAEVLRMFL